MKTFIRARYIHSLSFVLYIIFAGFALGIEPAAEEEIKTDLSVTMEQIRQNRGKGISTDTLAKKYGVALIPHIEQYMVDPNKFVRWQAYATMWHVGKSTNDIPSRRAIVYKFLTRLRDDDRNRGYLARFLLQFRADDFTDKAKEVLHQLFLKALANELDPQRNIVLLVGVADMKSELPRLKEFIEKVEGKLKQEHEKGDESDRKFLETLETRAADKERLSRSDKARIEMLRRMLNRQYWQSTLLWAALRARARMGVKEDIMRCIVMVESHPDEGYRVDSLLRELAYIRQPEVVSYLYTYLNSDKLERYKGRDVIRITYGQRAAMALAEMLRGFPGNVYDPKTLERARKWMAEQTKFEIIR